MKQRILADAGKLGRSRTARAALAMVAAFALDEKAVHAIAHITADARYVLWVNGEFVGRGPARGFQPIPTAAG